MRFIICISCVALLAAVAMAAVGPPVIPDQKPHYDLNDGPALFEKYIKDYNKSYKDAADRQVHYEAFLSSLKFINEANADPNQGSAVFDLNDFADFTEEQRKHMFGFIASE